VQRASQHESDEGVDLWCWLVPASLEGFFGAFSRELPAADKSPPQAEESEINAMMQSAAKHEFEMLISDARLRLRNHAWTRIHANAPLARS
jgi:hypothetical protein